MATPTLALPSGAGGGVVATERRRNTLPVAAAVAGVVVGMTVAGLVAAYLGLRTTTRPWPPKGVNFDRYTAVMLSITVLMAAVMIEWAAYGIRKGFRGQSLSGFGLTTLLAVCFLIGEAYLILHLGYDARATAYATVVYALCGVAFVVALAALVAVVTTGLRAAGGQITLANYAPMRATAILWHVAAAAWIAVYYTVYITK